MFIVCNARVQTQTLKLQVDWHTDISRES